MADSKYDYGTGAKAGTGQDTGKGQADSQGRNDYSDPEKVINSGDISLQIYSRQGDFGLMYNGKILKNYIDPNTGEMKSTYFLGERDLMDGIYVMTEGIKYIQERKMAYNLSRVAIGQYTSRPRSEQNKGREKKAENNQKDIPKDSGKDATAASQQASSDAGKQDSKGKKGK